MHIQVKFIVLETLNQQRLENAQEALEFGLALHVGVVLYGNIGIPDRIKFSVVGQCVNEVSRLESLTKEVGKQLLVSKAIKDLVDQPCVVWELSRQRALLMGWKFTHQMANRNYS